MKLRLALLAAAMLCVSGVASAQSSSPENYGFEGGLIFWKPSPAIVLTSGTLGTPVDFINTFAVEDKRFRSYRIVTKAGKHKIRFSKEDIKYDATVALPVTIRFQGQTYAVDVPTTAELDWHLTRIGYEWDAVSSAGGFLGLVFDLKYNKMNAQVSAPGVTTEIFEHTIPVPTVGGIARGYLGQYISATAELTGFKVNRSDFVAKFFDFDLYGTGYLGRNLGVQYGYRSVTLNYAIESDAGDVKLKGPYFGLVVRF
jgi:hypothetical protein